MRANRAAATVPAGRHVSEVAGRRILAIHWLDGVYPISKNTEGKSRRSRTRVWRRQRAWRLAERRHLRGWKVSPLRSKRIWQRSLKTRAILPSFIGVARSATGWIRWKPCCPMSVRRPPPTGQLGSTNGGRHYPENHEEAYTGTTTR